MHKMLPLVIRLWRLKQQIASLPTMFTKKCIKDSQDLTPDGSASKESACSAGDTGDAGSVPGLGGPPGGGMVTHSRIFAWWSLTGTSPGVAKNQAQRKQLTTGTRVNKDLRHYSLSHTTVLGKAT